MRGVSRGIGRDDEDLLEALCPIGVRHQFGNPHRLAGLVLAGEDADAAGRFCRRPLEGAEFCRGDGAVRQGHRALEIGRPNRRIAARADLLGAFGGIHRGERDPLDAFATLLEEGARRGIVFGRRQHAEQFHVVGVEHDGVVARSHMRAVGAARRHGEAEPFVIFGGLVEVLDHDHGVIDSDDVLECHFLSSRLE